MLLERESIPFLRVALLLASVVLFGLTPLLAQQRGTGLVTVRVSNAVDEVPIPHADVRLYIFGNSNFAYQGYADGGGRISLTVSSGAYRVMAGAEGYEAGFEEVDIGAGQQITILVRLHTRSKPRTENHAEAVSATALAVPDKARQEFAAALEILSTSPRAAVDRFQKAIDLYPDYAQAYCGMGLALLSLKERERAANAFSKSMELDPDYGQAYNLRARMYLEDRNCTSAIPLLQKSLRLNPQSWDAHYYFGRCLYEQNRMTEALDEAKQSQRSPRAASIVHLLLADIYLAQNQKPQSIAELEAFVREDPGNSTVTKIKARIAQLRAAKP